MTQQPQKILFASDLSMDMKKVFRHAATMAVHNRADIIILHVMEQTRTSAQKKIKIAFGEKLYQDIKEKQSKGARNILIGKNVDALKIRQAITGFFQDEQEKESPIKKILVSESVSIADEIVSTVAQEGCDIIIMGCKQQGLLAQAMGDKLVRKVLKRSTVPVLVVPFADK